MKFADSTDIHRKSGVAQWRDLLCPYDPKQNPTWNTLLTQDILLNLGRVAHVRPSVHGPKMWPKAYERFSPQKFKQS